jgi:hypothetical protein
MAEHEPFWKPAKTAGRVAFIIFTHFCQGAAIVICFWLMEHPFHILWREEDPVIFGYLPFKYVFQAMDIAVLLNLLRWLFRDVNRELRGGR